MLQDSRCPICGQIVGPYQVHYCPLRINPWTRPQPIRPMYPPYPQPQSPQPRETDDEKLRRIVREEIERALGGQEINVYLNGVKQ